MRQRDGIDVPVRRQREECLDLRSESEVLTVVGVVERFDSKAIPGQEQQLVMLIPDREGEHSNEAVDQLCAVLLIEVN
jgi:hypothetical protein